MSRQQDRITFRAIPGAAYYDIYRGPAAVTHMDRLFPPDKEQLKLVARCYAKRKRKNKSRQPNPNQKEQQTK